MAKVHAEVFGFMRHDAHGVLLADRDVKLLNTAARSPGFVDFSKRSQHSTAQRLAM
jgi:hypothetical protein